MLCIGHRGARGHAPENTLASVRKAIALGADWIEIDVYWVAGELVVFHDETLERTTNGSGLLMAQSFADLRSLDAGEGEQIPTLAEVFDAVERLAGLDRVGLNIELKGPGTAEPVVRFLQAWRGRDSQADWSRVLLSSFCQDELRLVQQLEPRIQLGTLFASLPDGSISTAIAQAQALNAWAINPAQELVTAELVQAAQATGLKVLVFTVNGEAEIQRLRALGVDGLFTDYPERVASL
jgi:glycerophosphoryl diester phosphodiesterase